MFGISGSSVCRIQRTEVSHKGRYWRDVTAGHPKFASSLERLRQELRD
jgi:hypothetical protein